MKDRGVMGDCEDRRSRDDERGWKERRRRKAGKKREGLRGRHGASLRGD